MRQPSKNIAVILSDLDPERYRAIIERAANNGYHDFKFDAIENHPEYANDVCPKIKLVEDLGQFPELNGLVQRVIDGEFDDEADEQDTQRMMEDLIPELKNLKNKKT